MKTRHHTVVKTFIFTLVFAIGSPLQHLAVFGAGRVWVATETCAQPRLALHTSTSSNRVMKSANRTRDNTSIRIRESTRERYQD